MHIADLGAGRMEDQAATPLPKCFCNWKNCRTYQKALREYKHPIFNGVVKLKFTKNDRKSLALKASVDRTLHVDATKKDDWKPMEQNELTCRYYVARHHFTEALMKQYMSDRRAWDWNEPLTMKQAKTFLWSLDRQDVYLSPGEEEGDDDTRYVQSPNVPKDQVREFLKKVKDDYKLAQAPPPPPAVSPVPAPAPKKGNSVHTQSTLSTTVTDTLKAFEDIIGHQELATKDVVLAQKEEENMRLRQELNECQEQLTKLHTMVKQLKVDMDKSRDPEDTGKRKKKQQQQQQPPQQPQKKKVESSSDEDESEEDEESSEGDGEDEEDEEEDDEEEDGDWSHGRLHGGRQTASDDDETISTFHVNGAGGSANGTGSNHSNRRIRSKTGSIHSRRSVRRDSVHSRRNSIHSRSRHSVRRDSIHSRRSMRGGMDDAASVVSRQSLQSVSPSIKSLPREIELMDDEEEDPHAKDGGDDYSFFDDSYRKPDDDARSVGSRSAASRASRRSMVSGARSRGRNSRRPGQPQQAPAKPPKGTRGSAVPREIDLSGDELEDETYANVSTDTLFVTDKQIVDPYGEKGVYTGALSKSTGMPNGKGRLEYEKEGRWYEGDWIHGRWTGYGRLSNGDGDFYEGGLKNDHKHGTGVMRFADGRVFEGEYIRGQMIQGKMTYQDGSVYGGSWVDGMRHGRGKCIFVDGSEYEGEFREGNFHGHGQMTWNDGGWYVGEWSDGEMHGRGKEIRPDGSLRHDGEWSRGQPIRSSNDSRRRRQQQQQPPQGELAVK